MLFVYHSYNSGKLSSLFSVMNNIYFQLAFLNLICDMTILHNESIENWLDPS